MHITDPIKLMVTIIVVGFIMTIFQCEGTMSYSEPDNCEQHVTYDCAVQCHKPESFKDYCLPLYGGINPHTE